MPGRIPLATCAYSGLCKHLVMQRCYPLFFRSSLESLMIKRAAAEQRERESTAAT